MGNIHDSCILKTKTYQLIISVWDEQLGPKAETNFGSLFFDHSPEEIQTLVENFFMTAISIYGNELVINEPTFIQIPVQYLSMKALLYFDAVPDNKARCGQKFTMIALLSHYFCNGILKILQPFVQTNFQKFKAENFSPQTLSTLITQQINILLTGAKIILENRDQSVSNDCGDISELFQIVEEIPI